MAQPPLFDHNFETAKPARTVYCHQEFLDKLALRRSEPIGKRTSLLMQKMAVDIGRLHYKATSGINKGWRRSRLGGSSGSHFYAWWAPVGAAPLKSFGRAAHAEAIFLRDIRHHDDHSPLPPGTLDADYLPMTVPDLRGSEYAPEPWTGAQVRFAGSRSVARILKGHPGSGKTTALLHAADSTQAEKVLYLTFSQDLAALAREYFDRFCSKARTFTVMTFPAFLNELTAAGGQQLTLSSASEGRANFRRDLQNHHRSLGAWMNDIDGLYDEMHAHLIGAAMPEKSGRFAKAERVRLPDAAYIAQRTRYLGVAAAEAVLEAAKRLDRLGEAPLADRYFPGLALAWRAAKAAGHANSVFSGYGCVAVDEVQDLTPLESFVVLALGRSLNPPGRHAPLLFAGDEAQTVRATDFEWAWLNDMLHSSFGQPQEFKLTVNLRSPRRIAALVNRTWEYYDYLNKQDRPSGTGYAEIDDDSPDQILYATLPSSGIGALLQDLSQREGLAVIAFDKAEIPKEWLPFVLTAAEAKGLDFHSVCVLNAGPLLRRIVDPRTKDAASNLAKRVAIDQLRVALSRPTERLIWVDLNPDAATVIEVGQLLCSPSELAMPPMTVEALRACLEEEELETEERVQRCQKDARQLLTVKPDMAWSRAHQAVSLLGHVGDVAAVSDPAARQTAYMTLAEVCFQLGFRRKALSPELGRPDLYEQSSRAARTAGKHLLANAILTIGNAEQKHSGGDHLNRYASAIQSMTTAGPELPAWLIVEIADRANAWLEELEHHMDAGDNSLIAQDILPPFFDVMNLPDAQARKNRLSQRAVQILLKNRRFSQALMLLEKQPAPNQKLIAECYEETSQPAKAAAIYLKMGDREKALKCYRSAPDFPAALELVRQMEGHPAKPSLEWLSELDAVLSRRPDNFNRVMTAPEKKLLEGMLEKGLGVQKKKPAAAPRKKAAAKTPRKRPSLRDGDTLF